MRINKLTAALIFVVILVIIASSYYHDMLFMKPSFLHAWAQGDRLALAISFYDNGMNFFKPSTFLQQSVNGITGVEFPLFSYLAAIAGKLFGRDSISTAFRLIDTITSCTGLLFLFMVVYKRTRDVLLSTITPLFIFCSPVFIYYTCNYLPDTAGASLVFISSYYILNYIDRASTKDLIIAMSWLTLASLIKTSAGLYLVGFAGFVLLHKLLTERETKLRAYIPVVAATVVSFTVLAGYYQYTRWLHDTYGDAGVFMAAINPFTDGKTFSYYIDHCFKKLWIKEYMVLPQYAFLFMVAAGGAGLMYRNSTGRKQLVLAAILLAGVLSMAYLLGNQLIDHDYYIIAILLPFIAFVLMTGIIAIQHAVAGTTGIRPVRAALLAGLLIIYCFANFQIHQRLSPEYYPFITGYPWMENGKNVLKELNVPQQEHIMVLNDDAANLALYYFDRKGYNISASKWNNDVELLASTLKAKQLHIMVLSASKQQALTNGGADLQSHFEQLYSKDSIAVYRLKD